MKYLIFDTETTGIIVNYKEKFNGDNFDNFPNIVQLAWILIDENQRKLQTASFIIKPGAYIDIPEEAAAIHGITTEIAEDCGANLADILNLFEESVYRADVLVAHNIAFDKPVLQAEFGRLDKYNSLDTKREICTMQTTTEICKLAGKYGYKWPKLTELYQHLFKATFSGAHDALEDVRACGRCFFELKKQGVYV